MSPVPVAGDLVAPGAAVEVATWRPVDVVEVDGWSLGFSGGFTRRANSAVPWRAPADGTVGATLDAVEAAYAARGLPAVVRVDGAAPPGLDALLAARGYARVARTLVLARDVPSPATAPHTPTGVMLAESPEPDDAWLAGWLDVKAAGRQVDHDLARAVVTGSPARYLTARDTGGVAGVVRSATTGEWVGLSCLMVPPRARRRGLARTLTAHALAGAARGGAHRAFLQVEEANGAATGLYVCLGFAVVDEYHYREWASRVPPVAPERPSAAPPNP